MPASSGLRRLALPLSRPHAMTKYTCTQLYNHVFKEAVVRFPPLVLEKPPELRGERVGVCFHYRKFVTCIPVMIFQSVKLIPHVLPIKKCQEHVIILSNPEISVV